MREPLFSACLCFSRHSVRESTLQLYISTVPNPGEMSIDSIQGIMSSEVFLLDIADY